MIYTTLVIVLSNLEQKMALLKFVACPGAQSHLITDLLFTEAYIYD